MTSTRASLRHDENIIPAVGWDGRTHGYRAEVLSLGEWIHVGTFDRRSDAMSAIRAARRSLT